MKTAVIAYLPGPNDQRFDTSAFIQNLKDNPPGGEMILFSDHDQPAAGAAGFQVIRLRGTVEIPALKTARIVRPNSGETVENKAAINNLIFLTALRIVEKQGYTHFLYLEEDCRVRTTPGGPKWDEHIFKEFFDYPRHLIMAGSVMAFNVANQDMASLERFYRFVDETKALGRRMPIPPYGWLSANSGQGSNVFVNGAGGIYSVAGLKLLFPERDDGKDSKLAADIYAWDHSIGVRLWKMFGISTYDLVGVLPSVCSMYGSVLATQAERIRWLEEGKFSLVHQIKRQK